MRANAKQFAVASIIAFAASFYGPANAALFDDDEARKKIVELQQQSQVQNLAIQNNIAELKKGQADLAQRLIAIEAIVKGQGISDLLAQIEQLKQDLNAVKGQLEEANHELEVAGQRQKDLYVDTDSRLRKLEGSNASAIGPAPIVGSAEAELKAFADAQTLMNTGKFKDAFDAYEDFLKNYPNSSHAPDAIYGLGYSQYSLKNYSAALTTQQKFLTQYPDHLKVPEAMFNAANSQIQLSDIDGAKKMLKTLLEQHPNSEIAPSAKKRLTVLNSIKTKK